MLLSSHFFDTFGDAGYILAWRHELLVKICQRTKRSSWHLHRTNQCTNGPVYKKFPLMPPHQLMCRNSRPSCPLLLHMTFLSSFFVIVVVWNQFCIILFPLHLHLHASSFAAWLLGQVDVSATVLIIKWCTHHCSAVFGTYIHSLFVSVAQFAFCGLQY